VVEIDFDKLKESKTEKEKPVKVLVLFNR